MKIIKSLDYKETGRFSKTAVDYLSEASYLDSFLPSFPYTKKVIADRAEIRAANFPSENRKCLVDSLHSQYANYNSTDINNSISDLADPDSVTITTGHQLCIFGGPLYFVYKIAGAIKLARDLREEGIKAIPIFWMATEDHDFEEISKLSLFGKDIVWETNQIGAVGRMVLDEGFLKALRQVESILGESDQATKLRTLVARAYQPGETLSKATRKFVHLLFGEEELLVLDADKKELKAQFSGIARKELTGKKIHSSIQGGLVKMQEVGLKVQVNPREINLFYLHQDRKRIVSTESGFATSDLKEEWSASEMIAETEKHPERFSPNVLLRPIYQEHILPNVAYIGGGAELAYWMELPEAFNSFKVEFPIVLLRDSLQLFTRSILKRWEKLGLDISDVFKSKLDLESKILSQSNVDFNIDKEMTSIQEIYSILENKALLIDAGLKGQLGAERVKLTKQLKNLEGRIRRSAKLREETKLNQLNGLVDKVFPSASLQERKDNILEYLLQDRNIIPHLISNLNPLHPKFLLAELE